MLANIRKFSLSHLFSRLKEKKVGPPLVWVKVGELRVKIGNRGGFFFALSELALCFHAIIPTLCPLG
jgi:hypothetical protein